MTLSNMKNYNLCNRIIENHHDGVQFKNHAHILMSAGEAAFLTIHIKRKLSFSATPELNILCLLMHKYM